MKKRKKEKICNERKRLSYMIRIVFLIKKLIRKIIKRKLYKIDLRKGANKTKIRNKGKKYMAKNKKLKRLKLKLASTLVKYHFVIGSSEFLLKHEPLEEMLRERAQFLKREKKPITFWLVKSPKFLNSNQLSGMKMKLLEAGLSEVELTAIISLDQNFITWLKLRLQNVGEGSFITGKDLYSPLSSDV